MRREKIHIGWLAGWLLGLVVLAGCAGDDTQGAPALVLANTGLTFSVPQRIVGGAAARTRQTADVVQLGGDVPGFRGLDGLKLFCFDGYPSGARPWLGEVISLPDVTAASLHGPAHTNYARYQDIPIPVGTTHVAFYARAAASGNSQAHDGALTVEGGDAGIGSIRFRPVPVCEAADGLLGSAAGQALLTLVNDLLGTVGPEAAPNDQWHTATDTRLQQTYATLTQLTTLASFHVEALLGQLYEVLLGIPATEPGGQLATLLRERIAQACDNLPATAGEPLRLASRYRGFPADLHLPAGAARIVWDAGLRRFGFPDVQDYGRSLRVPSVDRYVYPASLCYQVLSEVAASDSAVLATEAPYDTWQQVIDSLYAGNAARVETSTRSVAIVRQLQYAVGRLDTRVTMDDDLFYDAQGKPVDVSAGFTLTGLIIGGQHEADYNFRPVTSAAEQFIYDGVADGSPRITSDRWSDTWYTLGLETPSDDHVYMALELVNDGPDFQGADGRILHGATFYLVADLRPREGENYTSGSLDQIFRKDYVTRVNLRLLRGWPDKDGDGRPDPDLDDDGQPLPLNGLGTATYGLPGLQTVEEPEATTPELGLSVDLSWEKGYVFHDIVL